MLTLLALIFLSSGDGGGKSREALALDAPSTPPAVVAAGENLEPAAELAKAPPRFRAIELVVEADILGD